jgi:3-oxoacyl-[acyl-carrier-protein] synthase-1
MKIFLSKPGVVCSAGKSSRELLYAVCKADNSSIKKHKVESGQDFFAASVNKEDFEPVSNFDSKLLRIENASLNQIEKTIKCALQKYGAERVGACVGSCDNLTELSGPAHLNFFENGNFKDYSIEKQSAQYVARFVKERFGLKGPCNAFSTACSSSAGAIIKAAQLIKAGICDAVIAGGVDIASDTALMGFGSLEAISSEPVNPFSKNRHGITMGEAAAFFVLAREDLDETGIILAGYGESADAYHITSPDPEGKGAAAAMKAALNSAEMKPAEIGYLNLHGTGTKFNDSMEAKAVNEVFGEYKVPCSSTKGTTGHTLGAAAALELAVCFETLEGDTLPAQHWDKVQDEQMPVLNIVNADDKTDKINVCMSNSFAFGGANATLIIRRC